MSKVRVANFSVSIDGFGAGPAQDVEHPLGATFTFVTGGIRDALERARDAAGGKDVQIGGGVSTIRAYVREGLIDELHLAVARILLGNGEALFEGINWRALGYRCKECVAGGKAMHMTFAKQRD